jgi:hypothetical protein
MVIVMMMRDEDEASDRFPEERSDIIYHLVYHEVYYPFTKGSWYGSARGISHSTWRGSGI